MSKGCIHRITNSTIGALEHPGLGIVEHLYLGEIEHLSLNSLCMCMYAYVRACVFTLIDANYLNM